MTYTVQPNDSLSKIAIKFYGNAARYHEILDANPSITDEDLIFVGQVLEIPNAGGTMAPTPAPAPLPMPMPGTVVEKPQMTKAVMVIFALAAVALGYLVMKHFAEKKGAAPAAAANPDEEEAGVTVVANDDEDDEEVVEDDDVEDL